MPLTGEFESRHRLALCEFSADQPAADVDEFIVTDPRAFVLGLEMSRDWSESAITQQFPPR